jgi:hypothetical protein
MKFGSLSSKPLAVSDVVQNASVLDGQYVAVHGVLYLGEGSPNDSFVCLPKTGAFDGTVPLPPMIPPVESTIEVVQSELLHRLYGTVPSWSGDYLYHCDAIVVGQIRVRQDVQPAVSITNLWMVMIQTAADPEWYTDHQLYLLTFPENPLPPLPWASISVNASKGAVLKLQPAEQSVAAGAPA